MSLKRRDFIKITAGGVVMYMVPGLGLVSCIDNILEPKSEPIMTNFNSPVDRAEDRGGFYVEYINGKSYRPTDLDLNSWRLKFFQTVGGNTVKEISLSYDEIMQEITNNYLNEEESFFNTFQCVGNTPGGSLISNGYFTGIPLRLFLVNNLGMDSSTAKRVYFRCHDGYHTNHKIERIMIDDPSPVYFVYKFDGVSLGERTDGSLKHGYPVRLVVQGVMGMKSPKVITEIEVSDRDEVDGWWETRRISSRNPDITWADIPTQKVNSKIFDPTDFQKITHGSQYLFQGIALGGVSPVERMEIGISKLDDNNNESPISWQEATIGERPVLTDIPEYDTSAGQEFMEALSKTDMNPWPAPFVWAFWEYEWQAPNETGKYKIFAKAIDLDGDEQPFTETPEEIADGNNSIHAIVVQVT